jgi:hypothetical protein
MQTATIVIGFYINIVLNPDIVFGIFINPKLIRQTINTPNIFICKTKNSRFFLFNNILSSNLTLFFR